MYKRQACIIVNTALTNIMSNTATAAMMAPIYILIASQLGVSYMPFMIGIAVDVYKRQEADEHGRYTICNLYYDTPDFQLIRASLDKPVYKEKLRMRSYGVPADGDSVFVELKKKYKGVVYKRRTALEAGEALDYLAGRCSPRAKDQICREIDWFLGRYHPVPQVFKMCIRDRFWAA